MKRFQFPLERVERWRAIQAEIQKSRALQATALARAAKSEAESHEAGVRNASHEVTIGGEAVALQSYPGFRDKAAKQSAALKAASHRMAQAAAVEIRRLTEMDRAHRLLEKLHESRKALWEEDVRREEDLFAGEAFLARVQSRKKGA